VATFILSDAETQLLREACRTLDEIDVLRDAVDQDGPIVPGSNDQPRAHPAFAEMRAARVSLSKLLAVLALPDEDGDTLPTLRQVKARKAAETRWRPHNAAKANSRG